MAVSNILNTLPENDMDLQESVKEPLSLVYAVDTVMDGGKLGISLEEYEEQDGIVFVKEGHGEDLAGGLRPNDIIESVTYHFGEEEVTSKITCISDFKKILGMKELQPPIEIRYSRKIIHSPLPGSQAGRCCMHRGNLLAKYAAGLTEISRNKEVASPGGAFEAGKKLATFISKFVKHVNNSHLSKKLTEIQVAMNAKTLTLVGYGSTRIASISNMYLRIALSAQTIQTLKTSADEKHHDKFPSPEQVQDAAEMEAVLRILDPICFRPQHLEFTSSELWLIVKALRNDMDGPFNVVDINAKQPKEFTLTSRENIIYKKLERSELGGMAQRALDRLQHAIGERFKEPEDNVLLALLLDPRTASSANRLLKRKDEAGQDDMSLRRRAEKLLKKALEETLHAKIRYEIKKRSQAEGAGEASTETEDAEDSIQTTRRTLTHCLNIS